MADMSTRSSTKPARPGGDADANEWILYDVFAASPARRLLRLRA